MTRPFCVGIFDSGVGGLTVVRAILQHLPHVMIAYLGDTARQPYGDKSREAMCQIAEENSAFLVEQGADLVVMACHTASAQALERVRSRLSVPVVGMVEVGVQLAVAATKNQKIAILGTRGTLASGVYQKKIRELLPKAHLVATACPLLVPLIEEGLGSHLATRLLVRDYLQEAKKEGVDTVILGCTHYPVVRQLFQEELGSDVVLIDGAEASAAQLQVVSSTNQTQPLSAHRFFVSDNPERFRSLGKEILGQEIPPCFTFS